MMTQHYMLQSIKMTVPAQKKLRVPEVYPPPLPVFPPLSWVIKSALSPMQKAVPEGEKSA